MILDLEHAVEVVGMEQRWASKNFAAERPRVNASRPEPISRRIPSRIPLMMTKYFSEDEARALFRQVGICRSNPFVCYLFVSNVDWLCCFILLNI